MNLEEMARRYPEQFSRLLEQGINGAHEICICAACAAGGKCRCVAGELCGGAFLVSAARGAYSGCEDDGVTFYTRFRFNIAGEKEVDNRRPNGLLAPRRFVEKRSIQDAVQLMGEYFCRNGFRQVVSMSVSGQLIFKLDPQTMKTHENLDDLMEQSKLYLTLYLQNNSEFPKWGDYVDISCVNSDESFHHYMALQYRPVHNNAYRAFRIDVYSTPNDLAEDVNEDGKAFEVRLEEFQKRMDDGSEYRAYRNGDRALLDPIVDRFFAYWQDRGARDVDRTTESD